MENKTAVTRGWRRGQGCNHQGVAPQSSSVLMEKHKIEQLVLHPDCGSGGHVNLYM